MISHTIQKRIDTLTNEAWSLARESLELGETDIYNTLQQVCEKLTPLVAKPIDSPNDNESEEESSGPKGQAVFRVYKGIRYEAIFDVRRVVGNGRGSKCIYFNSRWMTPSDAGRFVTAKSASVAHPNVNGWRFWKYFDDERVERQIDELR